MKKFNIYTISLSAVAILICTILSHMGIVKNIDGVFCLIAAITALIFLVGYCLNNWVKSIVFAISIFIIAFGFGKLAMMIGNVCTYTYVQTANFIEINKIVNSDTHHHVMSYDGLDYYVDENFEYLYCIENNGFFSNVQANSIMIDRDAESVFEGYLGDFYAVNNNQFFSNINKLQVSIGFLNNSSDSSVFIKLIDPDNKVYYSYITNVDCRQLASDLNIIDYTIELGGTSLIITKPSKIINGTETGDEQDYKDGGIYFITTNDDIFVSEALTIQFPKKAEYSERVNTYLYRDYIATITLYEEELKKMDPTSDDYKEMESQINQLKLSMTVMVNELQREIVMPDKTIRFYSAYNANETLTSVPDINVIEIEIEGFYIYAMTNLTLEDLK